MHATERNYNAIRSRMLRKDELEQAKAVYIKSRLCADFTEFRSIPRLHAIAVTVLECMDNERINKATTAIKHLRMPSRPHKAVKHFVASVQDYEKLIDYILQRISVLDDNPTFNIYTIKLLIGQLLWGTQPIPIAVLESTHLLYYEEDIKELVVEADTVLKKTYASELPVYVRVNTLAISLEQCINAFCKEGWKLVEYSKKYCHYLSAISTLKEKEFTRDFHISELLVFPPGTSFYQHPGYLKGKFVLQDKGSCLASFLLNPKPGSIVLDMCAAPGRTTNHLANIINNEGIVYAVDNHPHRYNRLHSYLQLTNTRCAETIFADHTKYNFDDINYVLIDVSSTYTGLFYRRAKLGLRRILKRYYRSSIKTVLHALQNYKTAKRIVYSACTTYHEEGEKIVHYALERLGNSYYLLDVKELLWNQWFNVGKVENRSGKFPNASKCLRIRPQKDRCYGYFIAVFERNFEVPIQSFTWKPSQDDEVISGTETDDESYETPNVDNPTIPKTAINVNKFQRKKFYKKLKNKINNRQHPYLQNPQTNTPKNQKQNNDPGSHSFYQLEHSQLYP